MACYDCRLSPPLPDLTFTRCLVCCPPPPPAPHPPWVMGHAVYNEGEHQFVAGVGRHAVAALLELSSLVLSLGASWAASSILLLVGVPRRTLAQSLVHTYQVAEVQQPVRVDQYWSPSRRQQQQQQQGAPGCSGQQQQQEPGGPCDKWRAGEVRRFGLLVKEVQPADATVRGEHVW